MKKRSKVSKDDLFKLYTAMAVVFPNCFAQKSGIKKPLKIGIQKDLLSAGREHFPDLSVRLIKGFLADYCGGDNYLKSIRKGATRVDLNGNFAGFCTADDESFSRAKLKKIMDHREKIAALRRRPQQPVDLDKKLANLEYWDRSNSMSDNLYATSGRMAEAQRLMEEVRAQIKERDRGPR